MVPGPSSFCVGVSIGAGVSERLCGAGLITLPSRLDLYAALFGFIWLLRLFCPALLVPFLAMFVSSFVSLNLPEAPRIDKTLCYSVQLVTSCIDLHPRHRPDILETCQQPS